MYAKIKAVTMPYDEDIKHMLPEDLIAYFARISNPSNQMNTETSARLLKYLVKHRHWSPFEMVNVVMEVETTRDIARQILRHRSFSFQEYCVAGDTQITLELPKSDKGKRSAYKRTIAHLYKLQSLGRLPKYVRVYDEALNQFVRVGIKEVFDTGIKPVFKVTLANGKSITTTKEHKFLTPSGFMSLEDAVGLGMVNSTAVMTETNVQFACNGIPVHQNKEWLLKAKEESIEKTAGLPYIAEKAGVSYHTIRKWLKVHKIQFTPKERAKVFEVWNKGKFGYSLPPISEETREKHRASAKKGAESNLWRGGVDRSERRKIADWFNKYRRFFLDKANYKCARCESHDKLELHHIEPVYKRPDLAYEFSNIEVVCQKCHKEHHNLVGDTKTWRARSKGNQLTIEWSTVTKVEYMGRVQTYDMEVDHVSHNYVANGIVTHNSQRYADSTTELGFELREARLQDIKNRQNSIELDLDNPEHEFVRATWEELQTELIIKVENAYRWATNHGIAKEQARAVLPEGLMRSRLAINGTIRSWIHYCGERTKVETQKEHRLVAQACWDNILTVFPSLYHITEQGN